MEAAGKHVQILGGRSAQHRLYGSFAYVEVAIVVAPDALHKANYGGGDPYVIALPNGAADARREEEPHCADFVEYLRTALLRGGFPGWENGEGPPPGKINQLRRNLISF